MKTLVLFFVLCIFSAIVVVPPDASAGAPTSEPAPQTAPPDRAASSPTPEPLLVSGQVIDVERGYVVFASGDAFKLAPGATVVDDTTGQPPAYAMDPGVYAVATLDANSGLVVGLRTSRSPLPKGTPAAQVPRRYVVVASSPKPNPDLIPLRAAYQSILSRTVGVTVTVAVPPETPFSSDIYMTTDTSGWNPQAIKMQRLDGQHFRIQMELAGGTVIHYLFTRGSWNSVERDQAGLQRKPRTLLVPGGDVRVVDATVYRWADLQ